MFLSVVVLQKKLPGIGGLLLFYERRKGRKEEGEEGERLVRGSYFEYLFAGLRPGGCL